MGNMSSKYKSHTSINQCPMVNRVPMRPFKLNPSRTETSAIFSATSGVSSAGVVRGVSTVKRKQLDQAVGVSGGASHQTCPVTVCNGVGNVDGRYKKHTTANQCPLIYHFGGMVDGISMMRLPRPNSKLPHNTDFNQLVKSKHKPQYVCLAQGGKSAQAVAHLRAHSKWISTVPTMGPP
jgi:hypothetical protein